MKTWLLAQRRRLAEWGLVALWMGIIFYLSHQPAAASSTLSGGVLDWVLAVVPAEQTGMGLLHTLIRKAAHFGAYFILGVLVTRAIPGRSFLALVICFFYAVSDEVHQLFIPGRSGEVLDVVIDTVGALAGIAAYRLIKGMGKK